MVGQLGEQLGGLDRQPGPDGGHHGVAELGQQIGGPGQMAGFGLQLGQLGVLLIGVGQPHGGRFLLARSPAAAMSAWRARASAA